MELQKLVLAADRAAIARIAQFTRMDCAVLNGATSYEDGTAVIIVRANSSRSIDRGAAAIRNASSCQVPVIVVAGFDDDIGNAYLREAKKCGVPGECILLVRDGRVMDALGNPLGKPLGDTAIGVKTALAVARRSLKEGLLPEVSIWDGNDLPPEEDLDAGPEGGTAAAPDAPSGEKVTAPPAGPELPAGEAAPSARQDPVTAAAPAEAEAQAGPPAPVPGEMAADAWATPPAPAETIFPWYGFIEKAQDIVAVFGVKDGVGASMVAACLNGRLADRNSLYLEVGPEAAGYSYFGHSPAQAAQTGKYAYCDKDKLTGSLRPAPVLVAEVSFPEALDIVYQKAAYVVVVTDGSTLGFEKTQNWIKGGWRVDTLVVNKVLYGSGYPPEVYIREFNINNVIGIPGGNEEKVAIHIAQRKGILPFGKSSDLDEAIKTLAVKIADTIKK